MTILSSTPTITYSIPESREFFGRLLAPLGAEQLGVLSRASGGFKIFKLGVKKMNQLENVSYQGSKPTRSATLEQFNDALDLMVKLEADGSIDFAHGQAVYSVGSSFDEPDARAVATGMATGVEFHTDDEGRWMPISAGS